MSRKTIDRIDYLDSLIRIKATGKPRQLARKLSISERTLYEHIDLMRQLGAPIKYCKQKQSYYYQDPGKFCIHFVRSGLPN
jgi:predicted DNA-binding transcriptional regulator YafY